MFWPSPQRLAEAEISMGKCGCKTQFGVASADVISLWHTMPVEALRSCLELLKIILVRFLASMPPELLCVNLQLMAQLEKEKKTKSRSSPICSSCRSPSEP